jgi:hypothetical protein
MCAGATFKYWLRHIYVMDVVRQIYEDSFMVLNCKTTASVFAKLNTDGEAVSLEKRPDICGVPYCRKCESERQGRLMKTYKPYFDVYKEPHIRHIICTVPVVQRKDMRLEIGLMLDNVKKFHESIRKSLNYPFRAFLVIECHYQKDSDSYNFHVHYGVFSMIDITRFREHWLKAWARDDLIVKFPAPNGKPVYRTKKHAFLEYMTRRRVQQARTIPLEDYYAFIKGRQLLRRIGFNKAYLALVTTIRKAERETELTSEIFLGKIDTKLDFVRIEALFWRRSMTMGVESKDILTDKARYTGLFRLVCEEYGLTKNKLGVWVSQEQTFKYIQHPIKAWITQVTH